MEETNPQTYPKRILMTADTVGGVWTYALQLSRCLGEAGIEVHLATMGAWPDQGQQQQAARVPNLTLHPSDYPLEWMDDPWQGVDQAGEWLMQLQEQIRPDLIHLNNYCHGALDWQAPVLMVAHSCVFSWWESVIGGTPPDRYGEYFRRVQEGLRTARLVVAPTHDLLHAIGRIYGSLPNTAVVPNGSEAPFTGKHAQKQEYVFSMGRLWDGAKNISSLNAIARDLPWSVVVAGERTPPGREESPALDHLTHTGKLSREALQPWLNRAAIYALPARYEPFGLSILEAARAGCTLVLGDIPSLRENWIGAAFFVEPGNLDALHYTLTTLINRPSLRKKYAEKALLRSQAFSLERMMAGYLEKYDQLLTEKNIPHTLISG